MGMKKITLIPLRRIFVSHHRRIADTAVGNVSINFLPNQFRSSILICLKLIIVIVLFNIATVQSMHYKHSNLDRSFDLLRKQLIYSLYPDLSEPDESGWHDKTNTFFKWNYLNDLSINGHKNNYPTISIPVLTSVSSATSSASFTASSSTSKTPTGSSSWQISSHTSAQQQQCPQSDDHHILLPCTCNANKKEILCRGGGSSMANIVGKQLRNTFVYYAKWIPISLQRFDSIYINLRNLTIIDANIFNGIKFANILLSGLDLTYIHRDAFRGTEQHVYTVFIYGTNLSSQHYSQYDFFASIRTLINLQKLIIYQNHLLSIPEQAFAWSLPPSNSSNETEFGSSTCESQLTEIQITTGSIQSIETDAFASLVHLEQLSLSKNRINLIHPYAFRMHLPSNRTLLIDLTDNELNSTSFMPNALLGAQRPLKIHLGLNGCNVKLDHLAEEIFRPFLDEDPRNTIDVGRHCYNLQCGCQMAWALADRYRLRVKNFRCTNEQNYPVYFSDFMNNQTCHLYFRQQQANKKKTTEMTENANQLSKDEFEKFVLNESSKNRNESTNLALDGDFCLTKKCFKQGLEMNAYINQSVNPCDSFYDFACNGWENKHLLEYLVQVLSNGGSEYDNFVKVQLKIEENFEKLLTLTPENGHTNGMGNNFKNESTLNNLPTVVQSIAANSALNSNETPITNGNNAGNGNTLSLNTANTGTILPIINTKTMYTKCITSNEIGPNMETLKKVLNDIGGWPLLTKKFDRDHYRWENYFDVIVNRYTDKIFITIDSSIDEHQIKHLMLSISGQFRHNLELILIKSGNFIVSRRKLLSVKLNRLESYANYILATAMHFGAINHQNETIDEVWELIKFEKQLADIAKKSMGSEFMIHRPLKTLDCLINEVDWLYMLINIQRMHRITNDSTFTRTKSMFDVHYLIELSRLLARTDTRIIANYFGWRVIDSIGFLFGGAGFIDIQQNFYSTESKERLKSLRKQCLEPLLNSAPYLMARIYADKLLPPKARQNARQLVETVKSSFVESLRKKNWINESKRELVENVENININIGYPDWIIDDANLENFYNILNYTITLPERNDSLALLQYYSRLQEIKILHLLTNIGERINKSYFWDPLPLHVGATYDFVGHIVTIPMGLLQPPFYEDDRPFYLNYASLGSFFGHEMAHSVTPRYGEFDQLLPPWNANFLKDYLFKAQCFVSQYTNYYDKEADLHLDGTKTFEEDMSDLAGIQAAYGAYQEVAKRLLLQQQQKSSNNSNAGTGPILSSTIPATLSSNAGTTATTLNQGKIHSQRIQELPEYTNEMLFFISFAQKWCRSSTHVQTRIRISKSVHSPEKYRVNGALSNLDAFAKTFNCPVGSMMNPVKRCESW